MVELSTPVKSWNYRNWQSKGCRFNSCPFHCFFSSFIDNNSKITQCRKNVTATRAKWTAPLTFFFALNPITFCKVY